MQGCSNGVGMESSIAKGPYRLGKNPMNGASSDMNSIEPTSINYVNQFIESWLKLYNFSFFNKISLSTISKAFQKSMNS